MNIGFMQGRLVASEKKGRIQYFPSKQWKKEIDIGKSLNFKIMEWTINIENINKNPLYFKNKINNLKQFLKKKKIKVNSVTCDFFMQKPFFKLKKRKKIYINILKKIIINSQKIGIKYIILPLVDNSSIKNTNQENQLLKVLKLLSKNLKKNSKILFETDYSPSKVLNFIKKFNSKFGINYDTGNSASLGYNFTDETRYFNHVHNIHIKDRIKNGNTVRLGDGNWDAKKFFIFLKKIKYKKNLILQTARSEHNKHIEEILINLSFLKKFI